MCAKERKVGKRLGRVDATRTRKVERHFSKTNLLRLTSTIEAPPNNNVSDNGAGCDNQITNRMHKQVTPLATSLACHRSSVQVTIVPHQERCEAAVCCTPPQAIGRSVESKGPYSKMASSNVNTLSVATRTPITGTENMRCPIRPVRLTS